VNPEPFRRNRDHAIAAFGQKLPLGSRPAQVRNGTILLQKLAAMDLAAGPFVEPRFEALALTHFTQL
jgi:hypothetical protein